MSSSRAPFENDIQNLVVWIAQNRKRFAVCVSTVKLHFDKVLTVLEVKDWHSRGDIPYKDIVNGNPGGPNIQPVGRHDIDFEITQVGLGKERTQIGAPAH